MYAYRSLRDPTLWLQAGDDGMSSLEEGMARTAVSMLASARSPTHLGLMLNQTGGWRCARVHV
jgi:hypothetical protein